MKASIANSWVSALLMPAVKGLLGKKDQQSASMSRVGKTHLAKVIVASAMPVSAMLSGKARFAWVTRLPLSGGIDVPSLIVDRASLSEAIG